MEWHQRREVQKLRREWYKKLAAEGFVDIEKVTDAQGTVGRYLNGVSPGDLRRRLYQEETEDYYRYARQHAHTMRPGLERAIWEAHADGLGATKTQRALESVWGRVPLNRVKTVVASERAAMHAALAAEADANGKRRLEEWAEAAE